MTWCKHYRAMSEHETCNAGVEYSTVRTSNSRGFGMDFPCFNATLNTCSLLDWPTPEEINAEWAARRDAYLKFVSALANDICPHCQAAITRRVQVGRCVYAEPCGCRLYQGTLPKGSGR